MNPLNTVDFLECSYTEYKNMINKFEGIFCTDIHIASPILYIDILVFNFKIMRTL